MVKNKSNKLTLAAIFLNALQLLIISITFGGVLFLKDDGAFSQLLDTVLNEADLSYDILGINYQELMNFVLVILGSILVISLLKFIFGLIAYQKNSAKFNLIAGCLSISSLIIIVIFISIIFFIIYEVMIASLYMIAFYQNRKKVLENKIISAEDYLLEKE